MNTFTDWNDELYHHGIKGQKWGVRRFQNPDGTLINPKGGRAGGNGRQPSNKKTLGQRFSSGAKKVGGAVSYMRAWQKERAENAEKRAKLRAAKNEAKKHSLMYQTVKSLSDNVFSPILKSGTKLATTVIDKVGGQVVGKASDALGNGITKGSSWLFNKGKAGVRRITTSEGRAQTRQSYEAFRRRRRERTANRNRAQANRRRAEQRRIANRFGDPFNWTF